MLQKLTVGNLRKYGWGKPKNPQYARLIEKIWMLPKPDNNIEDTLRPVLSCLHLFPGIQQLDLQGTFGRNAWHTACLQHVTNLRINPLLVQDAHGASAVGFLSLFPKVQKLSLILKW